MMLFQQYAKQLNAQKTKYRGFVGVITELNSDSEQLYTLLLKIESLYIRQQSYEYIQFFRRQNH